MPPENDSALGASQGAEIDAHPQQRSTGRFFCVENNAALGKFLWRVPS
jgi:hypothetical protein